MFPRVCLAASLFPPMQRGSPFLKRLQLSYQDPPKGAQCFWYFIILFLLRLLSNTLLLSHIWGKDHQAGRRTMKEYTHVSEGFHPTEQQCPRTEPRHFTVWVGVGALPTQTLRNWKWPFVSPSSFPWPAMSDQPFISIYSSLTPKKSLRFSINTTLTTSDFPEWVWY